MPGVGIAVVAAVVFVLWVTGITWAVRQERAARAQGLDDPDLEPVSA